jgi:FtsH-binding integral membrane protein
MNFFLIFFERNIFKYEKNKKKLAQFLIFYYFMQACLYMYRHAYANIYIILILLRTSEIFFSIYTRAFSNKFNHYFIFAICKIK